MYRRLLIIALLVPALAAAGCGGDAEEPAETPVATEATAEPEQTQEAEETAAPGGAEAEQTFANTCGGCHTLSAAGTNGTVGPNLDELGPSADQVLNAIETGPGAMPEGLLQGEEAQAVADYVAENAGG